MAARFLREMVGKPLLYLSLLIAAATSLAYWRVSSCDFVSWDDTIHVYQNNYLQHVTLHNLAHFWVHPYYSLYIPIAYMAFSLISLIGRSKIPNASISEISTCLNPHVFHDANLILHGINSLLAFALIRKIVKSDVPAAFGALLFSLHPLQVESVAWISELRGLLSSALGLSSMLIYLSINRSGKVSSATHAAALALFTASLLTKPDTVVIPAVLFVWEILLLNIDWRESCKKLSLWFALAALAAIVCHSVQKVSGFLVVPIWQRAEIVCFAFGFYIEKLFWPVKLGIEYGFTPARVLASRWVLLQLPALLAFVVSCLYMSRKHKWILPCALTLAIFLSPVSGIVPFAYQGYSTVADRYMYLALLGPAIAFALSVKSVSSSQWKTPVYCVASVMIALLIVVSSHQVRTWRNSETLFANALSINPNDWLPHEQLGNFYLRHDRWVLAESELQYAAAHGPEDSDFWLKLGYAAQGQHALTRAIQYYDRAVAIEPRFPLAVYGRAQCESAVGDRNAALADYETAASTLPSWTYANYDLGQALGRSGRYQEAAAAFSKSIKAHPDKLDAYYYLALTYSKMGNAKLAHDVAEIAFARDSHYLAVKPYLELTAGDAADVH